MWGPHYGQPLSVFTIKYPNNYGCVAGFNNFAGHISKNICIALFYVLGFLH